MTRLIERVAPHATTLVRRDHTLVLATFHRYRAQLPPRLKRGLARSVCLALEVHTQLEDAGRLHGDFAQLNVTLQAIAENTKATHRATVELSDKVGALGERMAAVEAVQAIATPAKRAPRGRG